MSFEQPSSRERERESFLRLDKPRRMISGECVHHRLRQHSGGSFRSVCYVD